MLCNSEHEVSLLATLCVSLWSGPGVIFLVRPRALLMRFGMEVSLRQAGSFDALRNTLRARRRMGCNRPKSHLAKLTLPLVNARPLTVEPLISLIGDQSMLK